MKFKNGTGVITTVKSEYFYFLKGGSGVTLLFEHSPSWVSEIEHFEIFSCPQENQLARQFFVKFNLLLLFLIS